MAGVLHTDSVVVKKKPDRAAFHRDTWCILGLPFDALDIDRTLRHLYDAAATRHCCVIATPNLNFIAAALQDPGFRDSVIDSELSLADGMPIVWIARLLGLPIRERVAGSTLFDAMWRQPVSHSVRVLFLGGEGDAARAACQQLNHQVAPETCVGGLNPGFGDVAAMSTPDIITRINSSNANFLVVALGAKKGQAWIQHNRDQLDIPLICHLGAVVNFVAGRVQRAPRWVQNAGFEWLWRILKEPTLWRRYAVDGGIALRLVITRILPYAVKLRTSFKAYQKMPLTIEPRDTEKERFIHLGGAFTHARLAPAQEAFFKAVTSGKRITLDLANLIYIDSSAIALIMALYKYRGIEQPRVINLSQRVRQIFYFNNALYLVDGQSR